MYVLGLAKNNLVGPLMLSSMKVGKFKFHYKDPRKKYVTLNLLLTI